MNKNEMYLDYVNNFLTVESFAEYYNISTSYAHVLIMEQYIVNNYPPLQAI